MNKTVFEFVTQAKARLDRYEREYLNSLPTGQAPQLVSEDDWWDLFDKWDLSDQPKREDPHHG